MKLATIFIVAAGVGAETSGAALNCTDSINQIGVYKPVCGSNGETYRSECQFENAAKADTSTPPLTKLFDGKCDMAPNPFCGLRCVDVYTPVCSSDGKTYSNACMVNSARCTNVTLHVTHDGACTVKPTAKPMIKPKPTAKPTAKPKACDDVCPMMFMEVCGSDGKTYSNSCLLGVVACKNPKLKLKKTHDGACAATETPKREKKACNKIYLPVCGSDGKTYGNQCLLENAACDATALKLAHDGVCWPKPTKAPPTTTTAACAALSCQQFTECKVDAATGKGYCADVCDPKRCAQDKVCSLTQVACLVVPCPLVATCTKRA